MIVFKVMLAAAPLLIAEGVAGRTSDKSVPSDLLVVYCGYLQIRLALSF